jgi:hypothetical protein
MFSSFTAGYELSDDEGDIIPFQPPHHPEDDPVDIQPPARLLPPPIATPPDFDFHDFMRRSGGKIASLFQTIQQVDALLPPEPIIVLSQRAGGGIRSLYIVICCILSILAYFEYHENSICHGFPRREVLKQRTSAFTRSECEIFAFTSSTPVPVAAGDKLIQAVGNLNIS